jgi:hypothetical protein
MPLMEVIGPAYGQALEANCPSLAAQLDAALGAREADGAPEPELAIPKPDGPLSGMKPLAIVG